MVYCRACGLLMMTGFCLHGSADELRERKR
jgi:hypothetical protein